MTSSPPPPFDDGGELPETRVEPPRATHHEREREPNYLVRRAIAVGAVVAVLAGGSVVAGRIISDGDGSDNEVPVSADWNTVVVMADDEIRLIDPETGEVTQTYPAEEPLLDAESLAAGNKLLLMNDFGRITELDLGDGTIRRSSAPDGSTLTLSSENSSIVLAANPVGGDVSVVDTAARTTLDLGAVAGLADPLMFAEAVLVNRSASHVATADAGSFQSVLVDMTTGSAVLLAGQVVALNDDTVVTAQRAGANAELEFYDLQGERRGSANTESPMVTMLTSDATAIIVSADGAVASVAAKGAVEDIGLIGPAAAGGPAVEVRGGRPTLEAERLLVATSDDIVLLDAEGAVLARAPGELLSPAGPVSRCVLVGDPRPTGAARHIDLETGELLGEIAGGIVTSASTAGCTVAIIGDEPRLVVRGVEVDLGGIDGSITIAPDGRAYVVTSLTGEQLFTLGADDGADDEPAAPVELADEPVLIRFAEV